MEAVQLLLEKMEEIKKGIDFIKEYMVDADTLLSPEEAILLHQAREEEKRGETISLEQLKKELDL